MSNGIVKKNINKTAKLKKLEKQLKREQRCLSRKYEDLKKREKEKEKKGEATRQNIKKQVKKIQKLHHRINCIRTDYINKIISRYGYIGSYFEQQILGNQNYFVYGTPCETGMSVYKPKDFTILLDIFEKILQYWVTKQIRRYSNGYI